MADLRTTQEVLEELEAMRRRVDALQAMETEHDPAVAALRESEQRFRILYESNPSMYFTVDPDGTVLSVNEFAAKALGWEAKDLVGQPVANVFHVDDRDAVSEQLTNCAGKPGRIFHWEFRKIRRDGSLMWVKEVARAVVGPDGRALVLIVCEDISERKAVEESRRYNEERFRVLYEDNPSMYFTVDAAGIVLSVNRFGAEMLGYEADELVERSVLGVFHPEDRDAVATQLEICVANPGRIFEWEFRKIHRSGRLMWVKEVVRAVRDAEGRMVILVVCEDITERKQATEELRDSRESYRALYTKTPAMLHSIDEDTHLMSVSDHWLEVLGYERSEVLGRKSPEFLTAESRRRAITESIPLLMRTGRVDELPFQLIKKNGELIDVLLSAIVERTKDGRFVRNMAVMQDVTEKKRAEEALRRAHDEMEQRVTERTAELSRTVQQLVEEVGKRRRTQEELHESREHFRRLVENVQAILWESDAETWDFTYIGPQAVQLLGYPMESWHQNDFWTSHIHEDDRERAVRSHRDLSQRSKSYEVEYRMIAVDGRVVWFNDVVSVVREAGKPKILRGFMIDITARKEAEELLEKQRAFLRLVIDITPHCIFAKDRDGRYTLANQAVADLFGTTPEALIGKADDELSPETDQARFFRETDREVIDSLEERFIAEEPLTDSQGNVHWMQTVKRPFIGEDGSTQVLGSSTDISARKLAEEKLRESEGALRGSQRELRELTRKLLTAHEDERRRLAREMHDDVTQRLAALAIEAGKLERQTSAGDGALAGKLHGMKEQMVRLSQDVHALSRRLHPSILEDLGLVDAVQAECNSHAERERIRVSFESWDVPEKLNREVGLCLYRITQEALRNAVKHSGAAEVEVSLRGNHGCLTLQVLDRGSGFDPAQARGKHGIGLASMEERAKMIQAELIVDSRPGEGTRIEVQAPLRPD